MRLSYRAVSREGKTVKGLIEAKDVSEAASYLRNNNLLPVRIVSKEEGSILKFLPVFKKSAKSDLVFFTRQLSSMLASGLTLMESLRILKDQAKNPATADVVSGIIVDIEEGKSFSLAIARYPRVFSSIYISLIQAAETSGLLDRVLLRLADNLEKQQKLKSTIRAALMYPSIVIVGMIIVVFLMMLFVIPQLSVLYQNLNIALPLPTRIIVGISRIVLIFWPFILGISLLVIFFYRRWHKTEAGRLIVDKILLKMPIFGRLIELTILTEFTRTVGLLVGSGTLVVESLNQSADTTDNIHYKNAILGVARRVEKGITIRDAMSAYSLFPSILVQTVSIGEQTGKLDESLSRVSEYFEREVDQTVKTLTTAMEPFIMAVLGLGVAFLIVSVITPIYSLVSSIQ